MASPLKKSFSGIAITTCAESLHLEEEVVEKVTQKKIIYRGGGWLLVREIFRGHILNLNLLWTNTKLP